MTRGRLTAYLRYQLGDYLMQRASLPLALVVVMVGLTLYSQSRTSPAGFWETPNGIGSAKQFFQQGVTLFLPLGAFLASISVMSTDRQLGHFRFFFSKPVNSVGYYVQAFALHAVTFVALFGALTWVFGALTTHISVHRAMEAAALTFVLIGGLGFLLGALTRFDGALLALAYLVGLTMQQIVYSAGTLGSRDLPAWLRFTAQVLPPALKLDQLRNHLYAHQALEMADVWHVAGYGAGAFLLGLVLMRKLPLSR